ncbi:hypothetical protein F5Y16DRAFT_238026 [Xylariaceae sp. FL0255]|nr:hypothetical protein F5Y16DRAFT_238026 [Xylariaceae sp. FL0255]
MEDPTPTNSSRENTAHVKTIGRYRILGVLVRLFLGNDEIMNRPVGMTSQEYRDSACVGVLGKLSLLSNSLLGKCSAPQEIGGFTLLDVDVGGIPRDHDGIVRSGSATDFLSYKNLAPVECERAASSDVHEQSPEDDVSFNIEPDWEGNPDRALVCARYKGRRITTISTDQTDLDFCFRYVPPRSSSNRSSGGRSTLAHAVEVNLADIMKDNASLPGSTILDIPILVQSFDRPCFRYLALSIYGDSDTRTLLATDCLKHAKQRASSDQPSTGDPVSVVIIAGMAENAEGVKATFLGDGSSHFYEIDGGAYII